MTRKGAAFFLFLLLALAATQAGAATPVTINLVGTWDTRVTDTTANASVYDNNRGLIKNVRLVMKITDQQGDFLKGTITASPPYGDNTPSTFTAVLVGNRIYGSDEGENAGAFFVGEYFKEGSVQKIMGHWQVLGPNNSTGKAIFKKTASTFLS